jgi:curved DNA-binding protein CbpA
LRNFYDLLSVTSGASTDDIKKAFRREIARYHPDKVQHLGKEFQEMASGIAADLTEAYRILMDPDLRAKYNDDLFGGSAGNAAPERPRPPAHQEPQAPPPPAPASSSTSSSSSSGAQAPPRASSSASHAGIEFVKKASLSRLKEAITEVLGADPAPAPGFDLTATSKPKRGLFKKADDPVRLLVKFVPLVDGPAVAEVWPSAMKARSADAVLCLLLVGPGLAPSKDLAAAINEQRRKARNAGPVLVPVDVRDWEALFPPDTPASVRALVQRLKEERR